MVRGVRISMGLNVWGKRFSILLPPEGWARVETVEGATTAQCLAWPEPATSVQFAIRLTYVGRAQSFVLPNRV